MDFLKIDNQMVKEQSLTQMGDSIVDPINETMC